MGYLFQYHIRIFLISALDSASCFPSFSIGFIYFLPWLSIVFVCFSKVFPKKISKFSCSIIPLWSECNISLRVRYSWLSILPVGNADTFSASVLISYYIYFTSNLSFYIISIRLFLKRKGLSDEKRYGFPVHFL